jgi:CHAD domain-containing protein
MIVHTPYDGLWRKRLDALHKVWPAFLEGEIEALHKARVASRRIREALPIVGVHASPAKVEKLRRKVRHLTRYLGPIRELDVELGMIEKRSAADDRSRSALALVRREVTARRQALRAKLKHEEPVADLGKLLKKLEKVARSSADADHKDAWRGVLATTLVRRAKRLKAALDEAGPLYAPERIHDVRIAAKKLRYSLEIAADAGQTGVKPILNTLKREQERLGHLHDLQALVKHVHKAQGAPQVGSRLNELAVYEDLLERECRGVHAQFVEGRDSLFKAIDDVRHTVATALITGHRRQARVTSTQRRVHGRTAKRG